MSSRRRMSARRPLGVFLSLVMGASMAGIAAPMVAFAASSPPYPTGACGNSNYGQVKYTTSASPNKGFERAAPDVVFTIAPGQTSGSRTMFAQRTYTGKVTVSGSVKVDAGVIVASAEATVGLQLEIGGAWTAGESYTVGPYRNTTSAYRRAASYAGTRTVDGYYTKWRCGLSPSTGFYTWLTEHTNVYDTWVQVVAGLVWCDDDAALKNQFGAWSLEYDAASHC
jgi:hypothetical protein